MASLVCAAVMPVAACSESRDETPPPCPRSQAAFRLEITGAEGPLPRDTELTVLYQGSQSESYSPSSAPAQNVDVCCRAGASVSGSLPAVPCSEPAGDGGQLEAIQCELWTNGIAQLTVVASTYPEFTQTLEAQAREDGCGVDTVEVRVELTRGDAGGAR